jgi:acid phosphatase type 7
MQDGVLNVRQRRLDVLRPGREQHGPCAQRHRRRRLPVRAGTLFDRRLKAPVRCRRQPRHTSVPKLAAVAHGLRAVQSSGRIFARGALFPMMRLSARVAPLCRFRIAAERRAMEGRALAAAACAVAAGVAACAQYSLRPATDEQLATAIAGLGVPAAAAVFVGAGDIAMCEDLGPAEATARLLDAVTAAFPEALVFTTGDHAYPDGTAAEFAECYEPTWGRFNARTRPTPGNHDYETPGAEPYFDYFDLFDELPGARQLGYYGFELGTWHAVALNSIISVSPASTQVAWLEAELTAARRECVLAYWHSPLFSSGFHGLNPWDSGRDTAAFWQVLMRHGADVVVNGHEHFYERYAPQDADGRARPDGLRQFVIGSGGAGLHRVLRRRANSVYANNDVFGVLILVLRPDSYEWAFVGIDAVVHDRSDAPVACTAEPGRQELVNTAHGHGYRFVAPVATAAR